MKIESQEISSSLLKEKELRLFVKRIDRIHPFISGNKWYKLKYNLIEAKTQDRHTILTFGGAYSNHIAATAFSSHAKGFKSIGIIRGEEQLPLNSTLSFARHHGMTLHYISRNDYKQKDTESFNKQLKNKFGDFYLIPEGGTNQLAIHGIAEVLEKNDTHDFICCPVGSGGTISGIVNASSNKQQIIGFPAIKGPGQLEFIIKSWTNKENWKLISNYLYGGYAKLTQELIQFIIAFKKNHHIPLDAVYTGKMMMGIFDLVANDYFPKGTTILALHTGGLQGNKGMNERFNFSLPTN